MSNSYFNFTTGRMVGGENALAEDVNAGFDAVAAGFDKLPTPDATKFLAGAHETTTGSAGNFVLAVTADSYFDGMAVSFKANHSNSGACTLNVGSLGAKSLVDGNGEALAVGDIVANNIYAARYNSTSDKFHLVGLSSGNAADAAVVAANIADVATIADNIDELLLVDDNAIAAAASASEASGYADDALTQAGLASGYADAAASSAANLPNATTAGADKLLTTNAAGDGWEYPLITAAGKALLDDADAAAQRATLGFPSDALTRPRKNLLINGGFDVWQRGTSFTTEGYAADRWRIISKSGTGTFTFSRAASLGVYKWHGVALNYMRLSTSGAVGVVFGSKQELLQRFSGKTITISFDASIGNTAFTVVGVNVACCYGTGGTPSVNDVFTDDANLTTEVDRISFTFTLPDFRYKNFGTDAGSEYLDIQFYVNATLSSSGQLELTNVQLEFGDTATDFEYRRPAEELILCQRYYETGSGGIPKVASMLSTDILRVNAIPFKVTKRRVPDMTIGALTPSGHDGTPGTIHATYPSTDEFCSQWNWTGGTAGRAVSAQFTWIADAEL